MNSAYWAAADRTKNVFIRQLASFHTQGSSSNLYWYKKGTSTTSKLLTTAGSDGQTLLPHLSGQPSTPATKSFSPGSA